MGYVAETVAAHLMHNPVVYRTLRDKAHSAGDLRYPERPLSQTGNFRFGSVAVASFSSS